jgi:hypothetical protein
MLGRQQVLLNAKLNECLSILCAKPWPHSFGRSTASLREVSFQLAHLLTLVNRVKYRHSKPRFHHHLLQLINTLLSLSQLVA